MDQGSGRPLCRTGIYGKNNLILNPKIIFFIAMSLYQKLQDYIDAKLDVKINDNRSTMLSVRWEPDCTKISMHRMFLNAPQNVMDALACYIRREQKVLSPVVKAFIEDNIRNLDYSHTLDQSKLSEKGKVYNLREIYNEINGEYFRNELNLHITWFGRSKQKNKSTVTFGLYYDPLKLIKVNRYLDNVEIPHYLISYVIYHEMLHHVCPSYVDENGLHRIHSKEFKEKEMEFRFYGPAKKWIDLNLPQIFGNI